MVKKQLISVLLVIVLCGCLPKIQYENDKGYPIYVAAPYYNEKFTYQYYDSLAPIFGWNKIDSNAFYQIDSSGFFQSHIDIRDRYRYYFLKNPEEIYFVKFYFQSDVIRIFDIASKTTKSESTIDKTEKDRISARFKNEIILPMIVWGRSRGIPDSVMINKDSEEW